MKRLALFLAVAFVLCLLPASALADAYVIIPVNKTVTGLEAGQTAVFNFEVEFVPEAGNNNWPSDPALTYSYSATSGSISGDQSGKFSITVTGSGTFKGNVYIKITDPTGANNDLSFAQVSVIVKEISGGVTGWTYDDTVWTGTPTDAGETYDGVKLHQVSYQNRQGDVSQETSFTNTYSGSNNNNNNNNNTPNVPMNPLPSQEPPFDPSTMFTDVSVGICNANAIPVMPQQITVQLRLNGQDFAQAVLNNENGWKYAWLNMPTGNEWDAAPLDLPANFGYTLNRSGNSFCIQLVPEAEVAELPKTGGVSNLFWPAVTIAAALCCAVVLTLQQRRKKAK